MYELKRISKEAVGGALERAERYRLLNEPVEAESICRDVLIVDPENQPALVILLLALSDQFEDNLTRAYPEAGAILARLDDAYGRHYYGGILFERRAKAHWRRSSPGRGAHAYEWFVRAMEAYQSAIACRPPGNDDATLRWNTCARILMAHPEITPHVGTSEAEMLE